MRKKIIVPAALIILAALLWTAGCTVQSPTTTDTNATPGASDVSLFVYSGAGLKKPMNEIGKAFTEKTGINVEYTFAGAGALVSQMELSRKGDVFVSGGTPDYRIARDKGLVGEPGYVAYHVPIIAFQKGNPKNITSVDDLARPLKLARGVESPRSAKPAILFEKHGIRDAVEKTSSSGHRRSMKW